MIQAMSVIRVHYVLRSTATHSLIPASVSQDSGEIRLFKGEEFRFKSWESFASS